MMKNYEFSLRFDVSVCQLSRDEIDDRLYEAGCDDALVRHSRVGEVLIEFSREEHSALNALASAKQQILTALPQARILEAKPDYVGPTDIAKFYDVSRQRIQSIIHDRLLGVHAVTCVGNTQIFRLATVIEALEQVGTVIGDDAIREAAFAALQLNRENDNYGASRQPA